jgi:Cap4 SAVED domain
VRSGGLTLSSFQSKGGTARPKNEGSAVAVGTKTKKATAISTAKTTPPILGAHPAAPPFGTLLTADDTETKNKVPHRVLAEIAPRSEMVNYLRRALVDQHASPEALKRTAMQRAAIEQLGLGPAAAALRRFPTNESTRKGNLAEIVLAEYVVASTKLALPVYRLRYNTNVDQSMKGDDMLAFDLDSDPVRVVVGEAKFRAAAQGTTVAEIADALLRSQKAGVPASLQFVADRLFDEGDAATGARVLNCAMLYAQGRLRLDYVGLLLSNKRASKHIHASTPATTTRLVMISLGLDEPVSLVASCFEGLE